MILPNFPKNRKEKRGIIVSLVMGFIRLACEGISSYLYNKRQKALKKAFIEMKNQVNLEQNKIFHLEDSMVMCGIYNSDTLKKLIQCIKCIIKQIGMGNYLWVNKKLVSLVSIQGWSWPLCHKFSFEHNHNERKIC